MPGDARDPLLPGKNPRSCRHTPEHPEASSGNPPDGSFEEEEKRKPFWLPWKNPDQTVDPGGKHSSWRSPESTFYSHAMDSKQPQSSSFPICCSYCSRLGKEEQDIPKNSVSMEPMGLCLLAKSSKEVRFRFNMGKNAFYDNA